MSATEWTEVDVADLLPTGTVTLLLADIEGSTQLWESTPVAMTAAIALLNPTVDELVVDHGGVRPVEQGEGDSFVAAFARASDAVACALDLQRAELAPIKLRIGLHTGEVQLRDEGNYAGSTIKKAARLRDLAHGGQTVLSGATEPLVEDRLPEGAWLADLGSHPLRDLPRPIRVAQLCHPDLRSEFPPLRASAAVATHQLPAQLTSFVGPAAQIADIRDILIDNRLVTLTGAGGAGKTRLAIEVAGQLTSRFPDGIWYADLAPITHPVVVPLAVARALGLPDQPGRSIAETLLRFVCDRRTLLVLDNCEHLLEASASLVNDLLAGSSRLRILTTSREPLLVAGEVTWQVPSLSLADEAVELFIDRARHSRPNFAVTEDNADAVSEICRRVDGMPLAIELAAARVRSLSVDEIVDSLHDRFRVLTGGARTAVRRQQTLRASVDWSHALLTEAERILFRRLAVFMGGFDLAGAQAAAAVTEVERFQVLDQLGLLVDKSLVVAENTSGRTRYRLLETVRQYALEKLGESGEADEVRTRHRDHFASMANRLDSPARNDYEQLIEQVGVEFDNMRAAFSWSHESDDICRVLELASALQPLWLERGRLSEGLAWLDSALARCVGDRPDVPPTVRARALGDSWRLSQILSRQAYGAFMVGDLLATEAIAQEGRDLADEIGDHFNSRQCRWVLIDVQSLRGKLPSALAMVPDFVVEATAAHDVMNKAIGLMIEMTLRAWHGDGDGACAAGRLCMEASAELTGFFDQGVHATYGLACLARGDTAAAWKAAQNAKSTSINAPAEATNKVFLAQAALAHGELADARRWLDEASAKVKGWWLCAVLATRARVHLANHDLDLAASDAYEALRIGAQVGGLLTFPEILESLAELARRAESLRESARLYGAADAARRQTGVVRFKVHDAEFETWVSALRDALGDNDFDTAWTEGTAMSTVETIAYAQRGRGERKRPPSGWESLTPTELDVVRLVAEGIPNKDIAGRLFVSPRTVQSHLRHIYPKLGLTSRVQLAQEAARHS